MKTEILGFEGDDMIIRLDVETQAALAAITGRLIDHTPEGAAQRLYNLFMDEGLADDDFVVEVRPNDTFDPSDEDDRPFYIDFKEA